MPLLLLIIILLLRNNKEQVIGWIVGINSDSKADKNWYDCNNNFINDSPDPLAVECAIAHYDDRILGIPSKIVFYDIYAIIITYIIMV